MKKLTDLNHREYAVIDLDTGTVLGTNLVLVEWPGDYLGAQELLTNDSAAFDYGIKHGKILYVDEKGA